MEDWNREQLAAEVDEDALCVDDLTESWGAGGARWVLCCGHVSAERFCALTFDYLRATEGAVAAGEWLAAFANDEVRYASVWWGWVTCDGVGNNTVVDTYRDDASPVTAIGV